MKSILVKSSFLLLALVLQSFQESPKKKSKNQPNIIYILADDLGYGDVSTFNENGKIKTPHLDQLAADGMKFTDAHTSSSVCTPTRYGIITGRYNWRSHLKRGVLGGKSEALIPNNRSTVASTLKSSGYNTAFIGKWHLGWNWTKKGKEIDFSKPVTNTPNDLGFDYAYGHCGSLDMAPYVYVENGKATAIPTETTENKDPYGFWRKGLTAPDFVHDDVTPNFFRRSIKYIEEKSNEDKPYFLYLPLPSPHTPILPTGKWKGISGLNEYADFVMMVDAYMGELLAAVKASGKEDNTLIIFTSDNGCSPRGNFKVLKEKGHNPSYTFRGHKSDIFEGGHRVPFIAKWPKIIKAGTTSNVTICTTDFMATCAKIAGKKLADNEGEDSFNMMPLFKDPESKKFKRTATIHHSINGNFAIRKGDWKLAMCAGSGGWGYPDPRKDKEVLKTLPPIQLYNLKNDIGETTNLYEKYPEKVEELKALLTKQIQDGRTTHGKVQQNDTGNMWKQLWWLDKK